MGSNLICTMFKHRISLFPWGFAVRSSQTFCSNRFGSLAFLRSKLMVQICNSIQNSKVLVQTLVFFKSWSKLWLGVIFLGFRVWGPTHGFRSFEMSCTVSTSCPLWVFLDSSDGSLTKLLLSVPSEPSECCASIIILLCCCCCCCFWSLWSLWSLPSSLRSLILSSPVPSASRANGDGGRGKPMDGGGRSSSENRLLPPFEFGLSSSLLLLLETVNSRDCG